MAMFNKKKLLIGLSLVVLLVFLLIGKWLWALIGLFILMHLFGHNHGHSGHGHSGARDKHKEHKH